MDQLIKDLSEILSNPCETDNVETITSLMANYQNSGNIDWLDYKFANPHSYSRNLVHISEVFELVLLVWAEGQTSPIHNHNQSRCWFTVMEGFMNETQYAQVTQGNFAELTEVETYSYTAGDVAVVTNDILVHKVFGHGATLHLYSPPIYKCKTYDPITGAVEIRRPGFYTIYKKLLDSDIMVYKKIYDLLEEREKQAEKEMGIPDSPPTLKYQILANKQPSFLEMVDAAEFSKTNTDYL